MTNILVRSPNWLGDAIMASPALQDLSHREGPLAVACPNSLVDYFKGCPGVSDIIPLNTSLWNRLRTLRNRQEKTFYIAPPSFSSALEALASGATTRIGFSTDRRGLLLTHPLELDERFHYVHRYWQLLGGTLPPPENPTFHFPPCPEKDQVDALLNQAHLPPKGYLALAPGSRAPARRWGAEKFAWIVQNLPQEIPVVLLGAASDKTESQQVSSLAGRPVSDLTGQTPLPLLGEIVHRAGLLLTNESGLMHVAWALGTPMVVIAGPSNIRLTTPWGPQVTVFQKKILPCVPCVKNTCQRINEEFQLCLRSITPAEVLPSVKKYL